MKIAEVIEMGPGEIEALLDRVEKAVARGDFEVIRALAKTVERLSGELEKKNASIGRLRAMLFGASTESTKKVLPDEEAETKTDGEAEEEPKPGHGRNGADEYKRAKRTRIDHPTLHGGDRCPHCRKGKVYEQEAHRLVRVRGQAPLEAEVTECQCLRCNLCGEVFTAKPPPEVGEEKYDATARSMISLMKYGTGFPFNRLEKLEEGLGVPLPASTQWDLVKKAAEEVSPAHQELERQAAQGEVLHNDDTPAKILELMGERRRKALKEENPSAGSRKGIFTSGIVSKVGERKIALFFTGTKHAGENLADVLSRRGKELGAPIQMADALSRNEPEGFATILANCVAHSRRKYVEVAESFPDECRHVLEVLRAVYRHDAVAKERGMNPEERLGWHQEQSGPLMEKLKVWLIAQLEERKVEPNSGLGEAIDYMLKRWDRLTLFLRLPRAPLDNNIVERALKKAILHRKNALFFRSQNGARVGDIFMSLIHTAELCGANPFDYLTELQRHSKELAANPKEWMPWNYRETLARFKGT